MKRFIVILSLVLISQLSFGQYYGEVRQSQMDSLNNMVFKSLRTSGFERPKHVKAFDVFYATYDGFTTKSAFAHGNFVKRLHIGSSPESKKLMKIDANVYLCDENGNAFAVHDGYCNLFHSNEKFLTREMERLGIRAVYRLAFVCDYWYVFGVGRDGETYIISDSQNMTFRVQDCPDEIWENAFYNKLDSSVPTDNLRTKIGN